MFGTASLTLSLSFTVHQPLGFMFRVMGLRLRVVCVCAGLPSGFGVMGVGGGGGGPSGFGVMG